MVLREAAGGHQQALVNARCQVKGRARARVHGLLHCQTSDCQGRACDRDSNACHNILEVFMCMLRPAS